MSSLVVNSALVTARWLNEYIQHPDIVVLDATLAKVGHEQLPSTSQTDAIPQSRFFDLVTEFRNVESGLPNTAPDALQFQTAARKLGINKSSCVVIYDHHGVYSSPRAWWLFRLMGHQSVVVLDGGLPGWISAGFQTILPEPFTGPEGDFESHFRAELVVDADAVLDAIDDPQLKILDGRSQRRFLAQDPEPRPDIRGGHIPASLNLPVGELVKDGFLLRPDNLQSAYAQVAKPEQKLILSCGSGITACTLALGAEIAGWKEMAVYDGSWAEWGASDFPLESFQQ